MSLAHLRALVWKHYRTHGRHDLPWRATTDPYRILVSEVMLQQTQVARVIPKYAAFVAQFPTVRALAGADLRAVLTVWTGLGYNRRGKALHDTARAIVAKYSGVVPHTYDELRTLPGVGPYTASAVCVFAFNQPLPLLETNVRTVLFYHLLPNRSAVTDHELAGLARTLFDGRRPREWHWALMDYGSALKQRGIRTNAQSRHYTRQQPFKGSNRAVRGAIVRTLTESRAREAALVRAAGVEVGRVRAQLAALEREGVVTRRGTLWSLGS